MKKARVGSLTNHKMDTLCVHAGTPPDMSTGAINTPIYQTTTYAQDSVERYLEKGYSYSRSDNPTVQCLEHKIASLEGGDFALCFSSGMAAVCTILSAFLYPKDHCLITNCSYGGTNRAARQHFAKMDIEFEFVDMTDLEIVRSRMKPNTKMIFSETPTNPLLTIADVKGLSKIAAEWTSVSGNVIHVCDSTFSTPFICRPLDFGADVTLISTTKYYDGHNITTGGALVIKDKAIEKKLRWQRNVFGNISSPTAAFYQLQTVKTLGLRIRHQSATALAIAKFLKTHPKVDKIGYPGLPCFRQRSLMERQHTNYLNGGMIWFEVVGGAEAGVKLMNTVTPPWTLCENLGTVESIITCPSVFTHANMDPTERRALGITDGFIRLSCGTEDIDDLIMALDTALNKI